MQINSIILEQPYLEDRWLSVRIGQYQLRFDTFDPCQRAYGRATQRILAALPQMRKSGGKILFGRYVAISVKRAWSIELKAPGSRKIMVGDVVSPSYHDN
ncbi:uncharacterized protein N7484_008204 [Penicillium longicatenatum]|uniref:uncharacterized protein n=1 Tax=Penicillium longicatenatum TaxID=1561947 RepID=UPI002549790B|nr:uncharacterized protein N7484_008204 [Penicillium longicatenatum]KAJ5640342.1 hypothetical protein N7484_008204 [Penicillium longicatenatum]